MLTVFEDLSKTTVALMSKKFIHNLLLNKPII